MSHAPNGTSRVINDKRALIIFPPLTILVTMAPSRATLAHRLASLPVDLQGRILAKLDDAAVGTLAHASRQTRSITASEVARRRTEFQITKQAYRRMTRQAAAASRTIFELPIGSHAAGYKRMASGLAQAKYKDLYTATLNNYYSATGNSLDALTILHRAENYPLVTVLMLDVGGTAFVWAQMPQTQKRAVKSALREEFPGLQIAELANLNVLPS